MYNSLKKKSLKSAEMYRDMYGAHWSLFTMQSVSFYYLDGNTVFIILALYSTLDLK